MTHRPAAVVAACWLLSAAAIQPALAQSTPFSTTKESATASRFASTPEHPTSDADRWRRTSIGWEQIPVVTSTKPAFGPSQHLSLAQAWPAAWAAWILLSIIALSGNVRSNALRL